MASLPPFMAHIMLPAYARIHILYFWAHSTDDPFSCCCSGMPPAALYAAHTYIHNSLSCFGFRVIFFALLPFTLMIFLPPYSNICLSALNKLPVPALPASSPPSVFPGGGWVWQPCLPSTSWWSHCFSVWWWLHVVAILAAHIFTWWCCCC